MLEGGPMKAELVQPSLWARLLLVFRLLFKGEQVASDPARQIMVDKISKILSHWMGHDINILSMSEEELLDLLRQKCALCVTPEEVKEALAKILPSYS
jgi:hypothetical protein